jgi:MGT family glycosyltransferase
VHQIWYYSYNALREKIESTGAIFVSCDEFDMEQKLTAQDSVRLGKDLAFATKILVDTTLALDDKVCADLKQLKPDCIVADSMAVWGKALAMKLGIPFVSSTTTFAFNRYSSKIMKQSIGELLRMIVSIPKMNKQIKRLQDKGYPINSILDIIQNDNNTNTIVYTSPEFQPYSDIFSDKYIFVGPSIRSATNEVEKTKEKLIYISMGTINNDMLTLYKQCITAFSETDYQIIMSIGNLVSTQEFGILPDNISVFSYINQIAVLQKVDVFISHCGMNSVNESLYFGVPLVMLPQTAKQGGVSERVLQLKAGIRLNKVNSNSIFNAVNKLINDPIYKQNAIIISDGFKKCSGAKGAAEKILQ